MRVLLDENLPVHLHRRLREAGHDAEHIILLGQRGLPDSEIRLRLETEPDLVLLTQDTEFEDLPTSVRGQVIISRVPQSIRLATRLEVWFKALDRFLLEPPSGHLFELLASGDVVGWETRQGR